MMHGLHSILLFHVLMYLGNNALGSKIINGEKAPANSMLYMASLQKNGQHVCGGFLVSKDFVITAAHCEADAVVLGTHNLNKHHKTVRGIEKKCRHPDFVNVGHGNDILLLKLSSEVQLDNTVKTIQLPDSEINLKDKEICTVAGWGFTKTGGEPAADLRTADVPVIESGKCNAIWNGLPANVICAGGYGTDKGFCQGDSGGPLVCKEMAVGIVSFNRNNNCNYPRVPNIYTDVSKYLPWINNILKVKTC